MKLGRPNLQKELICVHCGAAFMAKPSKIAHGQRCCSKRCARLFAPRIDVAERFWEKVDRRGPDDCWEWLGSKPEGYGILKTGRRPTRAHRVAWELANGPIPPGLHVCHRCDNPPCCNAAHLFLGTDSDNAKDKQAKGRSRNGAMSGNAPRGEARADAKLTDALVIEIRSLPASVSSLSWARTHGVSPTLAARVRRGIGWRHVGQAR